MGRFEGKKEKLKGIQLYYNNIIIKYKIIIISKNKINMWFFKIFSRSQAGGVHT